MARMCRLLVVLALGALAWGASVCADTQQPATDVSLDEIDATGVGRAVKLSLVNGVVRAAQETVATDIALTWDLLPTSDELRRYRLSSKLPYGAAPGEVWRTRQRITIRNADLARSDWLTDRFPWVDRITDANRLRCLFEALGLEQPGPEADIGAMRATLQSSLKASGPKFSEYWNSGEGYTALLSSTVTPREYYSLLRDHSYLFFLLTSRGVAYSFDTVGLKPTNMRDMPREGIDDIDWVIDLIPVTRMVEGRRNTFYRCTIQARARPFKLQFRAEGAKEVELSTEFLWLMNPGNPAQFLSIPLTFEPTKFPLESVVGASIQQAQDEKADTQLGALLKFATGIDYADTITKGLLGGSRDASVMTGLLVSEGHVGQVVGFNVEADPTAKVRKGLLFGVDPSGDDSLYIGPSLSNGTVSLSAGLRIVDEETANGDGSLRGRLAGIISVDLSRLSGGKKPPKPLELNRSQVGGNFAISTDLLAGNIGALRIAKVTVNRPARRLTLRRLDDPNPEHPVQVTFTKTLEDVLRFLPAGKYQWEAPVGYKVEFLAEGEVIPHDQALPIEPDDLVYFEGELRVVPVN